MDEPPNIGFSAVAASSSSVMGEIAEAMAFPVKYRKVYHEGNPNEGPIRLPIQTLGIHENNRNGVFPTGLRCKSLCEKVFTAGFTAVAADSGRG